MSTVTLESHPGFPGETRWECVIERDGQRVPEDELKKEVEKLAQTAIEFPPMQAGSSFNLEAIKAQIAKARAAQTGQ